ncbi:hypothetical protein LCGC14_2495270 [marine sediment metagenome]|uniref:Uncharacterized protein n=1 Tax=marine sediment metagenome TaxID=412755 RepID=A0A0F9B3G5_9ZZZZ
MERVPQPEYDKAKGQLRLQVNAVMNCFRCYGLNADVDAATEELIRLAELFSMRLRGKDKPIMVRNTPRIRPTD